MPTIKIIKDGIIRVVDEAKLKIWTEKGYAVFQDKTKTADAATVTPPTVRTPSPTAGSTPPVQTVTPPTQPTSGGIGSGTGTPS